jgi:hypothetical protein
MVSYDWDDAIAKERFDCSDGRGLIEDNVVLDGKAICVRLEYWFEINTLHASDLPATIITNAPKHLEYFGIARRRR